MARRFYLDTYAIIEMSRSNPHYAPYLKDAQFILNKLNLMEFAYFLMKVGEGKSAKAMFEEFARFHVEYDEDILLRAAEMKLASLKQRLSFVDCIGYVLAKEHGAKFLTGDEQFRHKENVEFVK